jgi:hypothetical protein
VQLHLIVSFVSLRLGHASQGRDAERVHLGQVGEYWPDDQFWVSGRKEAVTWQRKEGKGTVQTGVGTSYIVPRHGNRKTHTQNWRMGYPNSSALGL